MLIPINTAVIYVKDLIRAYDAFLTDPEGKSGGHNIGGVPTTRRASSSSSTFSKKRLASRPRSHSTSGERRPEAIRFGYFAGQGRT